MNGSRWSAAAELACLILAFLIFGAVVACSLASR